MGETLFQATLKVAGVDDKDEVHMVELSDHRWFVATLFLPQLSSRPQGAHPLIIAFMQAARAFKQERQVRPTLF